jgi:hypothetical protein
MEILTSHQTPMLTTAVTVTARLRKQYCAHQLGGYAAFRACSSRNYRPADDSLRANFDRKLGALDQIDKQLSSRNIANFHRKQFPSRIDYPSELTPRKKSRA